MTLQPNISAMPATALARSFMPMRPDLPSLEEQEAFLAGKGRWTRPVAVRQAVDYGDGDAVWFAVRTNPKCEDRAVASLTRGGFDAFLPKGTKLIVHHRTRKQLTREFPLMRGYLFLAMPNDARRRPWGRVRECDGVKGVLGIDGLPMALPAVEVETLREAEASNRLHFEATRRRGVQTIHSFAKGDTLRIATGPFTGFACEVTDASSRKAIRVLLSVFGGLTEVDVPVDALESLT